MAPHRFKKGQSGNPAGLIPGTKKTPGQKMVIWHLREAARQHCEEALAVVAKCLRSEDDKVALLAAQIMLDRGYGKPKEMVDVTMTHNFAEVPQVMPLAQWLETRGQPQLLPPKDEDDPDRKLN